MFSFLTKIFGTANDRIIKKFHKEVQKINQLEEALQNLTDEETENVGALLLSLAESHSIIAIEHDMEFVRQIANDKVTVLHQGALLCEGKMNEVQNDPRVIEVYLGETPSQE